MPRLFTFQDTQISSSWQELALPDSNSLSCYPIVLSALICVHRADLPESSMPVSVPLHSSSRDCLLEDGCRHVLLVPRHVEESFLRCLVRWEHANTPRLTRGRLVDVYPLTGTISCPPDSLSQDSFSCSDSCMVLSAVRGGCSSLLRALFINLEVTLGFHSLLTQVAFAKFRSVCQSCIAHSVLLAKFSLAGIPISSVQMLALKLTGNNRTILPTLEFSSQDAFFWP